MENQEMFNEKDDPNSPAENNVPDEDPDDVFEDEEDVDAGFIFHLSDKK
jgi:hypothetical protein